MSDNTAETMLLDFNGWLGSQDEETRAGISQHLASFPDDAAREAGKQRLANQFAVAESTGLDLRTVDSQWDTVRGGFAEQKGGVWLAAKDDEAGFHAMLKTEAQQRKDERALLQGEPDVAGSRQNSLVNRTREAAYAGKSYGEAFADWQSEHVGAPGYDDTRANAYAEVAKQEHDGMTATLAKVRPLARDAFQQIANARDGQLGNGGNAAPFELFRGLSPDEKQLAFRVMTDSAGGGNKADWMGFFQASGEALGRGFENLAIGGGASAWRSRLLQTHFAEGDTVRADNAADEVRGAFAAELGSRSGANTATPEFYTRPTRKLTAAEAADWNAQIAQTREDVDTAEELRKFGQTTIDPTNKDGGWVRRKLWLPALDSAALMASYAVPGAWAPALELGARSYQGEEYQRLRGLGMDTRQADSLALVAGAAQAALDKVEFGLFSGVPGTKRVLEKFALGGSGLARFAFNTASITGAETLVELTQDQLIPALVQDNLTSDPRFDVKWADVWSDVAKNAPETALGMVLLSGLGGLHQTHEQTQFVRDFSSSAAAMRARGYSLDDIAKIQAALIEARGQMLADLLPAKAPEGAEKAAVVKDVAALAAKERDAFAEKQRAEAGTASDAGDYAIRVTRSGSGWWVTQGDKSMQVSSAEAAVRIRDDLKQAATAAEAEGFVALVDQWHAAAPAGATRETAVTGDVVRSDGQGVTRQSINSPEAMPAEMSPEALRTLREEAQMDAATTGHEAIDVIVNGSNTVAFGEKVASGASELIQRLEINRSDTGPALTFLHESVEADWRAGIASGAFTLEETQRAIAGLSDALHPGDARDAEDLAFRQRVRKVADGKAGETELRETLSELAVADAIGRRRDGAAFPAGSISAALDSAIRDNTDPQAVKELGKLRAFIRAVKQYFRALFGTVAAVKKARREGKAKAFDDLIAKVTGNDGQRTHDAARMKEAQAIADAAGLDYQAPTAEEEAAGVAFSLRRAAAEEVPKNIQAASRAEAMDFTDWQKLEAFTTKQRAELAKEVARSIQADGGKIPNASANHEIDVSVGGLRHWASFSGDFRKLAVLERLREFVSSAVYIRSEAPDARKSADKNLRAYHKFALPVRFDGQEAMAVLTVQEDGNGNWVYDGRLSDLDIKRPADVLPGPTGDEASRRSDIQRARVSLLEKLFGVNGGSSYRLSAGSRLEALQNRIDAALARDPEARRNIARRAIEKLQTLQFNAETMRLTGKGDVIEPIVEKRTAKELDREQAMRQALRTEELTAQGMATLNEKTGRALETGSQKFAEGFVASTILNEVGRLMSKTEAAKLGLDNAQEYGGAPWLPWQLWGGTIRPDEAAQILADMGVIKDGYPDTLWRALDDEMKAVARNNASFEKARKSVVEIERQARNTAKEEAANWRADEDAKLKADWSPRASLVRDLRALDAILSVLPAELRGKVGGFVKLATLGSDQARLKEIGKRIAKLDTLLEKHLRKESTAALDDLQQRAAPDREAGKASRGKLGAEGHRYFDGIAAVRDLTPEQVEAQRAAIEAEYQSITLTNEQAAGLFEREQILDTFGAWDKKTAAEMDAAVTKASAVYRDARNLWRTKEEARLAEVQAIASEVVAALGGSSDAAIAANKARSKTLPGKLKGLSLDLKSFAEVLDALLGENHPLAKRWAGMARDGLAAKNDEVRAMRKRWKAALENATGLRGVAAMRALWDMGQTQSLTVENAGTAITSTQAVPLTVIDSWATGADPAALGISSSEAAQLTTERAAMKPDDRRQSLELHRKTRASGLPVGMTEAEAIFLTMLGAQEQYREGLDRAGYTADVLAKMEDQLSGPAKRLREFMRNEYRDGYGPLANVFERMYGVALPQIRNYAPAAFYHEGTERAMDPTASGEVEGGFRAGFLKNRKRHVAAPKLENAFATFFGHVNQTAHWKNMAEFVREFSGVLNKAEVKRAIESAHGSEMLQAVNQWRRALEGNGLQVEAGALDRVVRWITSAQIHIALAWNIGTVMKQSAALFNAAYAMPLGEYARGLVKLAGGQLDARAMFQSDVIQRRLESGFAPEVRAAMNDIWSAKPTTARVMIERGTEFLGLVDALFTAGSAAIAYDYHKRMALESGLSDMAAHTEAMREVAEIVARTAQPADVADRSLFELRQNAFGKLLFMFASEARQKSSLALKAWGNTLTGKATAADVRVLVISHLIVGPMIQAITAAWRDARDDDDSEWFDAEHWKPLDFLKAIVAGPLAGVPLLGDLLSGFKNDGILGRFVHAGASVKQIFEGPKEHEAETVEWYVKRIAQVMQGMTAEIGVAGRLAGQAFGVIDNLAPDSSSEAAKKARAEARKK